MITNKISIGTNYAVSANDPIYKSDQPLTVIVATYNGARFICDFINSLKQQTFSRFRVIFSDDASSDDTTALIESASVGLDYNMIRNPTNSGPLANFSLLMARCETPYIATADQDDVWLPNKIDTLMTRILELERSNGAETPLLVYSNLLIVDEYLKPLYTFFKSPSTHAQCNSLPHFLVGNHIPGCSMLFNRALLMLAEPVPSNYRMHDWWIAKVAASFGAISYVDECLIMYRQHEHNTYGAPRERRSARKLIGSVWKFGSILSLNRKLEALRTRSDYCRLNITLFLERFHSELSSSDLQALMSFQSSHYRIGRLKILDNLGCAGSFKFDDIIVALLI